MSSEVETILERDHAELDRLLELTFQAIGSNDCRQTYLSLDIFWARLAMHIRAEHLRLFPAVRQIAGRDAKLSGDTALQHVIGLLDQLRHDHDFFMHELARAIKCLRLTLYFGNEPETLKVVDDLVSQIKRRLIIHNAIEEGRIYTLVTERYLPSEEIAELAISIKKELSNLPPRFRTTAASS